MAKIDDVMIYRLGPFRLDTQDNLLFRGSEPLALGRRALALLRALVERPGALVSKDALIEAAWPGQAVEESNLTVQIAALRKVLGEVSGGDRWIETMPRRGYRFIAPVVTEDANDIAPPPIEATRDPAPDPRADAERRQITAMSCELIGMSGRADGAGLEDLRDAIAAFQRSVSETVDRHGGFVVDHLGNAVARPVWLSGGARTRRRASGPCGARIVRGGQHRKTRYRRATAMPGGHHDGHGDHR